RLSMANEPWSRVSRLRCEQLVGAGRPPSVRGRGTGNVRAGAPQQLPDAGQIAVGEPREEEVLLVQVEEEQQPGDGDPNGARELSLLCRSIPRFPTRERQ